MAGSKEFSLLTKLTLNMAGYDTGIEQAKKKTSDLAKGTEAASKSISSSFAPLAGMTGGLTTSLSGIQGAVTGGISSFKLMIPAIRGVGTALISTGIGAIVVALGVAFAALTSYLGGSSEGAKQLKAAFAYVSGAITAVLNRVKLLGRALVDVFQGNFKKAAEDLEAAFKGGFGQEIINSAKTANALEVERQALAKKRREFEHKEAEEQKQINILNAQAQNKDDVSIESLTAKKKYLVDADKKAYALNKEKVALLQAEYDYASKIVKVKGLSASQEEKDNELSKWKELQSAQSEYYISTAANSKAELKLNKQIHSIEKADNEEAKKDQEALAKLTNENTELDLALNKESAQSKKAIIDAEIAEWKEKELAKINAVKASTDEQIALQKVSIEKVNKVADIKTKKAYAEIDTSELEKGLQQQKQFDAREGALLKEKFENNLISKQEYLAKMSALDARGHQRELEELELLHQKGEISEKSYADTLVQINDKYQTQKISALNRYNVAVNDLLSSNNRMSESFKTVAQNSGVLVAGILSVSNSMQESALKGAKSLKELAASAGNSARQIIAEQLSIGVSNAIRSALEFIPFPFNLAAGAAAGAAAVALFNSAVPTFATGGIVPGTSYTGDQVFARVNSGEMVLNAGQQGNLFSMLNNNFNSMNRGGGEVTFRIEGSQLVGVLNNHSKRIKNFG
ncbi:MAG: hypothetical protein Q8928_02540 [Bacteroidota bacterium]|nr:hypothetical protein [Bacteroidota bacterium]